MYPRVTASMSQDPDSGVPGPGSPAWSGDAILAGGVWHSGPATYDPDSAPARVFDPPQEGNGLLTGDINVPGGTSAFRLDFPDEIPDDGTGLRPVYFEVQQLSGDLDGFDTYLAARHDPMPAYLPLFVTDDLGGRKYRVMLSVSTSGVTTVWVTDRGHGEDYTYLITKVWAGVEEPPAPSGSWPLRQRQSLIGPGSWPLRQRQAAGHTGSWSTRQRQPGI